MGAFMLGGISTGNVCAGAEVAVNLREHLREAVRHVRGLPKIEREAWLAQAAGLLFCQDGRSAEFATEVAALKLQREAYLVKHPKK